MAAKTIKGITVEINGNATGLGAVLKDVDKQASSLNTNLKEVNKALKLDPSNTELLSEKQKILSESIDATKEKLQTLESVQNQIKQQYANGEIDQGAYLQFQTELERTKAKLEDLEKQQKDFGSVIQQQMEQAGQKVSEFGDKVSAVGTSVTKGVTTPIVAAGTAVVAAFNQVDDGVDTIIKATGASGEALDSLEASYKKLLSDMPVDMGVVASAVGEVNTRFHTTGVELESQTKLLIEYAEITGGDVVQATDDADKTLQAWGKTSEDLAGLLGMVASKSQETGINAQSLMQDVQSNSAAFKELGFSLEEAINFMAQMDANGVDSSAALTGLKKAVVNLTDAGMEQDEALRAVIDSIKNAATETEALQIAQETFGTKGAAEMATAIREGRIDIDALSDSVSNYGTVVEETYGGTVGDAADEAKTAMNAATVAGAELGEVLSGMLAPVLQQVTQIIRGITEKLSGMDEGQKQTIVQIALLVAAIGPVITIVGKVISGIGSAISIIGKLGTAMSFLAANPVVLIVAAIAALVAGLVAAYNNCEWFRDGVNAAIEKVKEIWTAACETVSNVISGVKETWSNVTSAISNVTDTAMTAVRDTMQERLSSIKSAYEENGGGLKGIAAATMEAIKGYYTDGWNIVDKLTGGRLSDIASSVKEKMEDAKEKVKEAIDKIKSIFDFDWEWPKLKMPHFSVTGSFSLSPPSVPKIGVEWYAKGGILQAPTIFGASGGNLLGGGEAGQEAVLPLSDFYRELEAILASFMGAVQSLVVQVNIEHFENTREQDVDDLADQLSERIQFNLQKKEAALT